MPVVWSEENCCGNFKIYVLVEKKMKNFPGLVELLLAVVLARLKREKENTRVSDATIR